MNRSFKAFLSLLLVLFLTACSTIQPGTQPHYSYSLEDDLEKLKKSLEDKTPVDGFYKAGKTPEEKRQIRNEFVSSRLAVYDLEYLIYIRTLTENKQTLNSATELTLMTLNLAGTLVGSAQAKTNLAAAATGIGASKSIIDKNYYYDKSIDALISLMDSKRLALWVNIARGLSTEVSDYPYEVAMKQLNDYRRAGDLMSAMQTIQVQAAKQESENRETFEALIMVAPTTKELNNKHEKVTRGLGSGKLDSEKAGQVLSAIGVKAPANASFEEKIGLIKKYNTDLTSNENATERSKKLDALLKKLTDLDVYK